ncbi:MULTISPECIES: response regulator [Eisenbergiella]|nr:MULTISPECIES: response regulator [Eisenbergiella]MDY2651295.1 response regulator [Eisenbergiella porci]MDY5528816.1 response regulator [Eisenbergiella porci]
MAADDEAIMRKAMTTLINWEDLGCELIYVASTGTEVMERLELLKPDILILDIQMPGKNGIEAAKYIWEQKLKTKVILLTAYADFSYAQQAVRYDVVDYVVKTGVMEGIVEAVRKAQDKIREAEEHQVGDNLSALQENFLKSVFSGSLYELKDVRENAARLQMDFSCGYLFVMIHFRIEENADSERQKKIHKSLLNFLKMVFGNNMKQGFLVRKNMLLVMLTEIPEQGYQEIIREQCLQIIDMMDNFMKMHVSIGVGERSCDPEEIQREYKNAEYAVRENFFDEGSRIVFYRREEHNLDKQLLKEIELEQGELHFLVKKGNRDEALEAFRKLLNLQKQADEPINAILSTGVNIRNYCKKILLEYDKSIYDVTPYQTSISELIYRCMHVREYMEIMETIIGQVSEYIDASSSRRSVLIQECEKYIEGNYEKNITVADIARDIGVSMSYLSRIFKDETGQTIIYTLSMKKLEKAKEYLRETDMKIYEVAEALGFENITYFSRFFKKYTNLSPKEYKEK